jgi:hypothetical protein
MSSKVTYHEFPATPSLIWPNLFLGSEDDADNLEILTKFGVTGIVQVGCRGRIAYPDTISTIFISSIDSPFFNLSEKFDEAFEWIDKFTSNNGTCFVHCKRGVSRSATVVIAYLMKKNNWTLKESYDFVLRARPVVDPNVGFYCQLREFDFQFHGAFSMGPARGPGSEESNGSDPTKWGFTADEQQYLQDLRKPVSPPKPVGGSVATEEKENKECTLL